MRLCTIFILNATRLFVALLVEPFTHLLIVCHALDKTALFVVEQVHTVADRRLNPCQQTVAIVRIMSCCAVRPCYAGTLAKLGISNLGLARFWIRNRRYVTKLIVFIGPNRTHWVGVAQQPTLFVVLIGVFCTVWINGSGYVTPIVVGVLNGFSQRVLLANQQIILPNTFGWVAKFIDHLQWSVLIIKVKGLGTTKCRMIVMNMVFIIVGDPIIPVTARASRRNGSALFVIVVFYPGLGKIIPAC